MNICWRSVLTRHGNGFGDQGAWRPISSQLRWLRTIIEPSERVFPLIRA